MDVMPNAQKIAPAGQAAPEKNKRAVRLVLLDDAPPAQGFSKFNRWSDDPW